MKVNPGRAPRSAASRLIAAACAVSLGVQATAQDLTAPVPATPSSPAPRPVIGPPALAPNPLGNVGGPVDANAPPAPPFATLLQQTVQAPRLLELNAEVARSEGLAEQARAYPNPNLSLYTENIAGSRPYGGFGQAETTLQINQPLELPGKRAARIAAGRASVVAVQARTREQRVTYAFELARAYATAEAAAKRIELAEDEVEEASTDLRAARALVDAGREARLRSLQAETSLNEANAGLEAARANRILAFARLSALAGALQPYGSISDSLLDRSMTPASGPIDPETSAIYIAAKAERDAASQRLRAERTRTLPDITASVGVRRLEFTNSTALVAGVAVPLRIFDRNRGNNAAAAADVQVAEARLAIAANEVRAGTQSAAAQAVAADARVRSAGASLATANETYRLGRIAYEAGKSSIVELLAARRGVAAARGSVLDALYARFEARAQLARLQGRALFGDQIQ